MTNIEVTRFWHIAPIGVELRIRRLKHNQELSERPSLHAQEIAAVLGSVRFGQELSISSPVQPDGRLAANANPWAVQIFEDLDSKILRLLGRISSNYVKFSCVSGLIVYDRLTFPLRRHLVSTDRVLQ